MGVAVPSVGGTAASAIEASRHGCAGTFPVYRIGDDGGGSADVNDEELNALLETTAAAIGKRIDGLFQFVAEVRARVDDVAARAAEHRKPLDRTALATIRPLVQNILQRDEPLLEGIGVAVGREALVDTPRWLEWWRRDTADSSHFVRHILNPDAVGFYDYQSREWFVHPIEQQRPLAIGPYVDAGGIEVCTVTLTMPLPLATGDVSVVGGDLSIPAMEHLLLESLGTCARRSPWSRRTTVSSFPTVRDTSPDPACGPTRQWCAPSPFPPRTPSGCAGDYWCWTTHD